MSSGWFAKHWNSNLEIVLIYESGEVLGVAMKKENKLQIRNSTAEFLIFTRPAGEVGKEQP